MIEVGLSESRRTKIIVRKYRQLILQNCIFLVPLAKFCLLKFHVTLKKNVWQEDSTTVRGKENQYGFTEVKGKCLAWCGSVDWAWACKPKGRQFNSQSGHISGLQARSLERGAWEATTHWCFSPFLLSFPSLKKKKK